MRRLFAITGVVLCISGATYFAISRWAIRHETIVFQDAARDNRSVAVDIAVRRDKEMRAAVGVRKLPVAILIYDHAVKSSDFSFPANFFAGRGYVAISVHHDLGTGAPLETTASDQYTSRLPLYERGVADISFVIEQLRIRLPNLDFDHLTLVGSDAGGSDASLYFAKSNPDQVTKVITLSNARIPFLAQAKFKILSFRSKSPAVADPNVAPDADEAALEASGIQVVKTGALHTDMSDRGPEDIKKKILDQLDKFLSDAPESSARVSKAAPELACRNQMLRLGVVSSGPCVDVGDIVSNLEVGKYIFNKPETAFVGDPFRLILVLKTSEAQDVLLHFDGVPGAVTERSGKFAQSIEATLRGSDLEIKPAGPQQKTVTKVQPVEWEWTITPLSGGKKTLTIDVVANIQVGAEKHQVQVTTLHEAINIQVSIFQRVKLFVAEANGYVLAAGASIPALGILFGVVWKVKGYMNRVWRGSRRRTGAPRAVSSTRPHRLPGVVDPADAGSA